MDIQGASVALSQSQPGLGASTTLESSARVQQQSQVPAQDTTDTQKADTVGGKVVDIKV